MATTLLRQPDITRRLSSTSSRRLERPR